MPTKTQYQDDSLCRIEARGDATLAEIHVELRRHMAGPHPDARILLDLRGAMLRAEVRDVKVFHAYLEDELLPELTRRAGILAWLPGVDPDLINPFRTGLSDAMDGLSREHPTLRIAEDADDLDQLLASSHSA